MNREKAEEQAIEKTGGDGAAGAHTPEKANPEVPKK
jgi:hypothetical protein